MALYAMLVALGQGAAKNPNANVGGSWLHDTLNKYDPIGRTIVDYGGDPLNLYGEKNNPGGLIFPSSPTPTQGGTYGGMGAGMPTGFTTGQAPAMYAAYQNFLKNLGAPRTMMPGVGGGSGGTPGTPQRPPGVPSNPGWRGPPQNGGMGDGVGGNYRGPAPGGGYGGMFNMSRFQGNQPTMPIFPARGTY